jgi:hypothetical protein
MIWDILLALLMIGAGLGIMGFGIFLFYAFRPLFYALLGWAGGVWFASLFTGSTTGFLPFVFGIVGAVILALLSSYLAPFARLLLGIAGGASVGLAIASVFGWGGFLSVILAVVGAFIGMFLVPLFFDPFIIVVTAIAGSALLMDGIFKLIPGLDMVNRSAISTGSLVPLIIWIVLAAVGLGWQFRNIGKWVNAVVRDEILLRVPPPAAP